ncbi:hypothetical protein HYX17_00245 [Candidatus Woesearchaeota archaeon]|nr:hypothetical protein [Candidatus Woesearchaeota archaeon]
MALDLENMTYEQKQTLKRRAIEERAYIAFGEIAEDLGELDYPENSPEKELLDRYIVEKMIKLGTLPLELKDGTIERKLKLKIPRMTESPTATAEMMRRWLNDFYGWNNIKKPTGLHKKNKNQLLGLYFGTLQHYKISLRDIVPE